MALIFLLLAGYTALVLWLMRSARARGGLQMTPDTESALKAELYKGAYELAAQRYENLYNAVWTNFSYMSVIAAGIISFAADKLYLPALVLVAFAPLLFWYRVTYKP